MKENIKNQKEKKMYWKLLSEFLGSAFLVFSVFASKGNYLVIGATLALIVLLIGKISGAAVNPAIAFAYYKDNRLDQMQLFSYIIVEMLGGFFGYFLYNTYM